ncbi:MAG TPA: MFS transporter, partial [Gemmatimonadaceae bacterium]|nr:MFS transporter [Gemmatimonadaceae bacterium]
MASEWSMSPSATTWLTMAVQLGFVAGTCTSAALLLSDRLSARYLAALCAFLAAASTALIAVPGVGPGDAIALRAVTGAALAGVYPPGIKIAAGWWKERRGTAIGILVGALTLGSASPNLFRLATVGADWRATIITAAVASLGAAVLFVLVVREGPYQAPSAPFDARALGRVLRHRGVALATGGYLGHMWELYAMWSSIGLFWAHVASRYALSAHSAPVLAFITIAAGAIGCVVAGVAADRVGRANVTIAAMAVSGFCALVIGPLVATSLQLVFVVAIVWGVAIIADSA